jgi:glyoxylase-like metal-dependent hydrolase (beta-lactamase superfamily II)
MKTDFERAGLIVLERGWLSSNNVLFAGDAEAEAVLVDSGYWRHADQTLALVRAALGGRRLDRIVNTHLHSDHCGGNFALQQAHGCAIDVPVDDADSVDRWDEAALSYADTGQHCPRFSRSGVVRPGSQIVLGGRAWQAIASPGHDPNSVVLYQPDSELLISADALWENGFGVVFPELDAVDAFDDVRATLERIAALPLRWVIPGHGAPFSDAAAAIDRARRRLDGMVAQPARHARHGAKVLIKFRLLEVQRQSWPELRAWIDTAPYLRRLQQRFFAAEPFDDWIESLVAELRQVGALRIDAGQIVNA